LALERITPPRTGILIATFRCDAPARRGAVVDESGIIAAQADARCSSSRLGRAAPRLPLSSSSTDSGSSHLARIATLRCAAPARRGAFVDETAWRYRCGRFSPMSGASVAAGDHGRVY
jgi:hypothetical protein